MKLAEDFRRIARISLTNNWLLAVVAGLVASLFGATGVSGPKFKINIDGSNSNLTFNFAGQDIFSTVAVNIGIIMVAVIVMLIVSLVLGSFVGVGYAKFNLNLVDKKNVAFETLFEYFSYWKTTMVSKLLRALYVFFWSLLFVIPGIVAGFSYAMTDYILAENPYMTASEAIEQSKAMMYGNRFRLFCLQLSFIGWDILATLTFGIGYLFLTPYKQAAFAAFYREVSGTERYFEEN